MHTLPYFFMQSRWFAANPPHRRFIGQTWLGLAFKQTRSQETLFPSHMIYVQSEGLFLSLRLPPLPTDIIAYQIDLLFRWLHSPPLTYNTQRVPVILLKQIAMCKGNDEGYFASTESSNLKRWARSSMRSLDLLAATHMLDRTLPAYSPRSDDSPTNAITPGDRVVILHNFYFILHSESIIF